MATTFERCVTPGGVLNVRVAGNLVARGLGLLVGRPLAAEEGLLIAPCSSIHTLGMRYAIDVVFVDRGARVLRVYCDVRAARVRIAPGARGALELRSGVAALHGLASGVRLQELTAALA